jgi:RimJ/RimL family protein N-acetyltransferase
MKALPSPKITTARLELHEYGPGDADLVAEAMASGEPEALPPGIPVDPARIADWLAWDMPGYRERGAGVHLAMVSRETGRLVGSIGIFHLDWEVLSGEIGYGVRSDQRSNGYATEALAGVSAWVLREGGLQRAWLTANTDNVASVRVAEKAGFYREGTLRRAGIEDDGLHDQALFSLLDSDIHE